MQKGDEPSPKFFNDAVILIGKGYPVSVSFLKSKTDKLEGVFLSAMLNKLKNEIDFKEFATCVAYDLHQILKENSIEDACEKVKIYLSIVEGVPANKVTVWV